MIELIAYGQKPNAANDAVGTMFTLDLSNAGAVSLTYEVSKGSDVMGRFSPFSQTFRLPFTNINSEFFGHYYDVNIVPTAVNSLQVANFNVHKKCVCEIRVDGVPIIKGTLQLKNVHNTSEEYEVAVFGQESNIFQELKDLKLIDLFINDAGAQDIDYDVPLQNDNISNSWTLTNDVTDGNVGAGVIIFPLADYGLAGEYNFLHYENYGSFPLGGLATDNFLQPYMFKPAIQVAHLFEKIIEQAGFSLVSNSFLTSDAWTKLYMTLANERESTATRGVLGLVAGKNDAANVHTFTTVGGETEILGLVPLNADSGVGINNNPPALFDEADNWSTTTYKFTAPATGTYFGQFNIRYDSTLFGNTGAQMGAAVFGSGSYAGLSQSSDGWQTIVNGVGTKQLNWELDLEQGDTLQCSISVRIFGSNPSSNVKIKSEGTYFTVYASDLNNGIAQMPQNMPDIQQADFVRDLCERFNLCIVADQDDVTLLNIQPWQDYIDAGTRKDWTHKLDTSKEFTITPTDAIRNKFIHFEDAEGDTLDNKKFHNVYEYTVGRYKQEVGHDFTSGTLSNSPIFAPFQVSQIPRVNNTDVSDYSNVLIHKGYGEDTNGPISSAKPKLFYYNGKKTIENGDYFKIGTESYTEYPLCLPFYNNGDPIASDSPLLLWEWQPTASFNHPTFGSTPSSQGYFARYWQQFLMGIYGDSARLVECFMMLSASDIFDFKFNDEINIENAPYRVLKISNYQPFSDVPCKVQLLKKVQAFPAIVLPQPDQECDLQVTGLLQNNTVVFTNPVDGTTSSGTEECCTENGYVWNGTQCLWATGPTGTGNGNVGGVSPVGPISTGKGNTVNIGGVHSVKLKSVQEIMPMPGAISTVGKNLINNLQATTKSYTLYATTYGSTGVDGSQNGLVDNSGTLIMPAGFSARIIVRALSVQTDNYSGTSGVGSFGSTLLQVFSFYAKNLDGTIVFSGSEQTDFQEGDADATGRVVSMRAVPGSGELADLDMGLGLRCQGPTGTVINWNLDVTATLMQITSNHTDRSNLLLLEDLGDILTEDNEPIEQE